MNHIEQIKQKLDIVEYIGADVELRRSGRLFKACCPFHDEKTPSFIVDPERQSWHCYGSCQEGGDLFSYVMKKQSLDFLEVLRILAPKAGVELPATYSPEETNKQKRLLEINTVAQNFYFEILLSGFQAEKARMYLRNRQVNESTLVEFKLGYAPADGKSLYNHLKERSFSETEMVEASLVLQNENGHFFDRFRDVITFPISNRSGQCVGFGVRIMDQAQLDAGHAKYINSPKNRLFDKSSILYALHLAAIPIRNSNQAVIMEGYMDVITAHQAGYKNSVASMGTAVTEKQIEQLKRLTNHLVLALDNDKAGHEAALRCVAYENLLEGEIRILHLPEGKDPDEFIKNHAAEWPDLLKRAVPIIDYLINHHSLQANMQTAAGKSSLVKTLSPILAVINDRVRQEHYFQKLSQITGINAQTIKRQILQADLKSRDLPASQKPAVSNPTLLLEEYILCLLAQNEELISECPALEEHFGDHLNKSIYIQIKKGYNSGFTNFADLISSEKWQVFQTRELPPGDVKLKMLDCCLRLKQAYLRQSEERKASMLAVEGMENTEEIEQLRRLGIYEAQALRDTFYKEYRR